MKKLMRVLIGYDGSSPCDEALNGLSEAGLPARLEAIVLSAADDVLPAAVKGFGLTGLSPEQLASWSHQSVKHARGLADSAVKRVKAMFPSWTVRAEAPAESPVHAIVDRARRWKADLIVMGAHGHSQIGRFMGSISQLVLTHAPCSVRIGRVPLKKARKGLRILIAFDGSSSAEKAAHAVGRRHWPSETKFQISFVLNRASTGVLQPQRYRSVASDMMKAHVSPFLNRLPNVEFRTYEGDPKQVLVNEAERWKADCIFIGARNLTEARRLLLGGVSMAVAARAHCSVEVVRE